jgi:hypothetical protein
MVNSTHSSDVNPTNQEFLQRVKFFLENCPSINPGDCSDNPSVIEKIEKIKQAFIVINQEVSDIEKMQMPPELKTEDLQFSLDSERENIQPQLVKPITDFLGFFRQVMDCRD